MRAAISGALSTAAFAFAVAAFAQTAGQTPQPSTPAGGTAAPQSSSSADQQVTVSGCVQSEADYRRSRSAGGGGVAGTGVGAGNEFVLADASTSPTAGQPAPTGTAGGATPSGTAYELTGSNEGKVAQYVGKRVEISGKLKAAEVGAAGPTGGPTAGAPPRGVDVTSKDLQLRELEVTSVRETTGTCPAAKQ
jgi:hypothetical protein